MAIREILAIMSKKSKFLHRLRLSAKVIFSRGLNIKSLS